MYPLKYVFYFCFDFDALSGYNFIFLRERSKCDTSELTAQSSPYHPDGTFSYGITTTNDHPFALHLVKLPLVAPRCQKKQTPSRNAALQPLQRVPETIQSDANALCKTQPCKPRTIHWSTRLSLIQDKQPIH